MNKPTLREVASASGYSLAAVSMILNGKHSSFAKDTVAHVLRMAEEIGYVRNSAATSLRTGQYDHIAIMTPARESDSPLSHGYMRDNPFFSEFFSGMEGTITQASVLFGFCRASDDAQLKNVVFQRRPHGVVVLGKLPLHQIGSLAALDIPIVVVDCAEDNILSGAAQRLVIYNSNDLLMGSMAMEHLLNAGHRKILLLFGTLADSAVHQRRYRGAMAKIAERSELEIETVLVESSLVSSEAVETLSAEIASHVSRGVTAVLCMADILAVSLYKELKKAGIRVPDDVSIIGMDGLKMLDFMPYELTTIDQHIAARGSAVTRFLIGEGDLDPVAPSVRVGGTVRQVGRPPLP
jgi:LacI family transcriptional regulator